jgi:hypothetical protein
MAKLKLTVACDSYDYLQPLREGRIQVEGIDLNLLTVESGIRHQRFYHNGEYDACEFSMSSYLVARGKDTLHGEHPGDLIRGDQYPTLEEIRALHPLPPASARFAL